MIKLMERLKIERYKYSSSESWLGNLLNHHIYLPDAEAFGAYFRMWLTRLAK